MVYNLWFFLFAGFLFSTTSQIFTDMKILKTTVFPFLPIIKQHHVVVLKELHVNATFYAVDFTPAQYTPTAAWKQLLGQSVPAEVRMVPLEDISWENTHALTREWISQRDIHAIRGDSIYYKQPLLLDILSDWKNDSINLYNHNCQHFSWFLCRKIRQSWKKCS